MSHALIIDDNMVISRAIENRLASFGFDSIDRTWTERQAVAAAARHVPDLIVVGDSIAQGSPNEVARQIARTCAAPILMVTTGRFHGQPQISADRGIHAPFHVTQLDAALMSAGVATQELALCA